MNEMYGSIDPMLMERAQANLIMYLQRLIDINEVITEEEFYVKS
jgi:hypothetical protein